MCAYGGGGGPGGTALGGTITCPGGGGELVTMIRGGELGVLATIGCCWAMAGPATAIQTNANLIRLAYQAARQAQPVVAFVSKSVPSSACLFPRLRRRGRIAASPGLEIDQPFRERPRFGRGHGQEGPVESIAGAAPIGRPSSRTFESHSAIKHIGTHAPRH